MASSLTTFLFLLFLFRGGICNRNLPLSGCDSAQFDVLLLYVSTSRNVVKDSRIFEISSSVRASFGFQENDTESRVLINSVRVIKANDQTKTYNILLSKYNNELIDLCRLAPTIFCVSDKNISSLSSIETFAPVIFNKTGIGRKNSTRVVITITNSENILHMKIQDVLKAQENLQDVSSNITNIFVFIDEIKTFNEIYFKNILLTEINTFKTGHVASMVLCGQCKSGWFEYKINAQSMSCYKIHVVSENEDWFEASERCGREGGYLAAVESKDELEFLQERLYFYILENEKLMYDSTRLFPNSVTVYIGLRWNSKSKGFQWMTKNPNGSRPLVLNNWLPGIPKSNFNYECGVWQFKDIFNESQVLHAQQNSCDKTMFSDYKSNNNDGWADVDCRTKFTKVSLCEVSLHHSVQDLNLKILYQSSKTNFSVISSKAEFRKFGEQIMSVSAYLHIFPRAQNINFPVFSCEDYKERPNYISYSYVCDDTIHCSNRRDENDCRKSPSLVSVYTTRYDVMRYSSRYTYLRRNRRTGDKCKSSGNDQCYDETLLPLSFFTDNESNCSGYSLNGQIKYDNKCPSEFNRFQCLYESQFRIQSTACYKSLLNQPETNLEKVMVCPSELEKYVWAPRCVSLKGIDGSNIGCRNLSHLQNCTDFQCQKGYYKCPGSYCIPEQYVLDGDSDCPRREDEIDLPFISCNGNFVCLGKEVCLHPDLVCDGHPDCPHKDDELNCKVSCAEGFLCIAGTVTVNGYNKSVPLESLKFIDSETRFLNLSGIPLSLEALSTIHHLKELRYMLLSKCNITNSHTGFGRNSHLSPKVHQIDMSYNEISSVSEDSINLNSFTYLRDLNLSFNSNLAHLSFKASIGKFFRMLFLGSLITLDVSHSGLSYLDKGCFTTLDNLKYLNLSYTKLSSLHWEIFSSSQILETLDLRGAPIVEFWANNVKDFKIKSFLYTDNVGLCCPQIRGSTIPAHVCQAPEDAISSCFDLIGVEIQRILLWVVAVIALVGNLIVIVYRLLWDRDVLKRAYGLFVTNLAASDLIMGLYLLMIAGADVYYRGMYVLHDKQWKESVVCKVAGFLVTFSSETSTFFIFFITVDRFLIIRFPYGQIKFTERSTTVVLVVTWLIGFILALVTVLPAFGSGSVFISNAMCLAISLSEKRLPGWEYSVSVFVVLNFVMFLVIALGQIAIFRSMSANRMSKETTKQNLSRRAQDITVAKQLSLVVLSNFCCWFPIGLLGLLSLAGHVIINDVYAWVIVLVLPINSAVNPILYTIPLVKAKWNNFKYKYSSTFRSKSIEMASSSNL